MFNFDSIFIKSHKSESKNNENFNFESISSKNHKFESKKIINILILNKLLLKITNLSQKVMKILIDSILYQKIIKIILNKFISKIVNLYQKNNENINFESTFI